MNHPEGGRRRGQPEGAGVRREVDDTPGREAAGDEFEEFHVIALRVPRRLAPRRPRERRHVRHDEVERRLAPPRPVCEERPRLVADHAVASGVGEAVGDEVPPRPVEVGVGEIDARRLEGTPRGGMDREAAGVAEEIEAAPPVGLPSDQRPRLAVVEEETGVEVVGEVDLEAEPSFPHGQHRLTVADLLVLPARALAAAHLEKTATRRHAELGGGRLDHAVEPDLVLDLGPLVRPLVLGGVQPAGVPVDDERDLGDVAIVDAKRLDPLAAGPPREVPEPFREAAAEVADLVGRGPHPEPFRNRPRIGTRRLVSADLVGSCHVVRRWQRGPIRPAVLESDGRGGTGWRVALPHLDLDETAGDGTVHEGNAPAGA